MKTIGIISAIEEEISLFLHSFSSFEKTVFGKRTFYTIQQESLTVVIVFSRWGKVAASASATTLINQFNVDEIVFSGVAGALDEQLEIGDIVIADVLFQHDLDPRPLFQQFEIPLLNKIGIETDISISNQLKSGATDFSKNGFNTSISTSLQEKFQLKNPTIYIGNIISGDRFVADKKEVEKLKKQLPNALCVEMEGAAIAQVCYEYDVPFAVIRIISDKANSDAPIDFPLFTKSVSSIYANHILNRYLKHWF